MLARKFRLPARKIKFIYKKGKVFSGGGALFFYQKSLNTKGRVAVVVGKKVSNKAVKRNKLRRQTQSMISKKIKKMGGDLIILVRSDKFFEVKKAFELWKKSLSK